MEKSSAITTCLSGQVVLDLGQLHPGPHTAMLLGQLGATVIKVERPGTGDTSRSLGIETFAKYNRGKRSIALDLKRDADKDLFLRLVKRSHALIEGFRPGVMARLGLAYEELNAVNSALVMCSVSGFGQNGPYAQRPGHDLNYLALAGYWAVPSQVEDSVARPRVRLSDYCGSMYAALAMVVAMMTARQTGRGQHLDVSLHRATMAWTWPGIEALRRSGGKDVDALGHVMPDNDLFETADGYYIALGILEEKFWHALVALLGPDFPELCDLSYDSREGRMARKRQLNLLLRRIFASRNRSEWEARFQDSDIPWSPVLDYDEILADPHVSAFPDFLNRMPEGGIAAAFPVGFSDGLPETGTEIPVLDGARREILDWLDGKA